MTTELMDRICALRLEMKTVRQLVLEHFPPKSFVRVDCDRFIGIGRVIGCWPADPTQLHVMIGNGNSWCYPADQCRPVKASEVSRDLRLAVLRRAGIRCSAAMWQPLKGTLP